MSIKTFLLLFGSVLLFGTGLSVQAAQIDLFDWAFNVDGVEYTPSSGLGTPPINPGAFDFSTGLGTIQITVAGLGLHTVDAFFDHELTEPGNSFFNETGASNGTPAVNQSWEIDEPGSVNGDIFENLQSSTLDNAIGMSIHGDTTFPDDVSMAMGWDFTMEIAERALISFVVSEFQPSGVFYLAHSDPSSGEQIYLSSTLSISAIQVPTLSTLVLMGIGLAGLFGRGRRLTFGKRC
ncbi:MAG: hypothetical protein GY703_01525 [Gammaproteobacteria bacterium]|nr:hypothetical protein [Gammaproteobacteria bacterium]